MGLKVTMKVEMKVEVKATTARVEKRGSRCRVVVLVQLTWGSLAQLQPI